MVDIKKLESLAKLVRYYILRMTTKAGSGHATSALSATDIMVALFFEKLRFDIKNPQNPNNDRVIFSKGHASPLLYALWGAAGVLSEKELDAYRKFKSPLEGHPTPNFKYVDVATGSLGQGLSIGVGMALALRQECQMSNVKCQMWPKVYVLMGDSETAEGSVWEAIELASYYKLDNLVGIIDVNRLGQSGPTMFEWDIDKYKRRIESFGWQTHLVDGHDLKALIKTFDSLPTKSDKPQMIIAKTIKGKGVPFLEDREGWHGKALSDEDFKKAVKALGKIDKAVRGKIARPISNFPARLRIVEGKSGRQFPISNFRKGQRSKINYKQGELIATRKAFGETLVRLGRINPDIVSLDAEVKNSTFSELFKDEFPDRFFEMFIAEQNMVGAALGFSKRGKIPFVSTFSAFLTRAFDQIRMVSYSSANIKFIGSHAGVSIGEDGPSQMGLEDLAMFRAIYGSTVFYPADAVATQALVEIAAENEGIFYIRTNRPATPVIYGPGEKFKIGGSKVVRSGKDAKLTIVACGVTLIEAIKAADELAKQDINVRVIDAYSIKPIDQKGLQKAASETNNIVITVEDHYPEGGLGDAVLNVFAKEDKVKIYKLAVYKMPMSGKPEELLDYEEISHRAIVNKVLEILG